MTSPEQAPTIRSVTKDQALRLAADAAVDPKTVERWASGEVVRRGTRERLEASWERLGYAPPKPLVLDGPLRPAAGPNDHEGLGRERFWDMTPEQRAANLPEIVKSTGSWVPEPDKLFASGWLAEHARFQRAARRAAPVCPRCLDLTPGTPGGTPETPHPGPFAEELCAACERAVKP